MVDTGNCGIVLVMLVSIGYFTGMFTHIPGLHLKRSRCCQKQGSKQDCFRKQANAQKDTTKDTIREAISRQLDERTERENALRFENEQKNGK